MSFSHIVNQSVQAGGSSVTGGAKTYSAGQEIKIEESCPVATDTPITLSIDVSAVKSIIILSDRAITLETNNGGAPVDSLVLKANVPYIWNTDSYDAFVFGTDVTVLFVTNTSGGSATLKIHVLQDPTP